MPNLDSAPRTSKAIPSRARRPKGHTQRAYGKQACKPVAGILAVLTLACLGLTACGGSSGSSTQAAVTSTTTSASHTATSAGSPSSHGNGTSVARQKPSAIRECLQKNGVTLPKRTPGSGGPVGSGAFPGAGGGPALPKGMTRAQFEATLKKCGGGNFGARFGRPGGPGPRVTSPVFRNALAKFAVCLRHNGVNVPAPNTSGKGPIFNTKGIKTTSPQFRAASAKCRSVLVGAFRPLRRPNGGASGTGTAPPVAGQAQGGASRG
jgi:hypothetical protein